MSALLTKAKRTKQTTMERVGKGNETVDVKFNHEWAKFKAQKKSLMSMRESMNSSLTKLKELSSELGKVSQGFSRIYTEDKAAYRASQAAAAELTNMDEARKKLDASWTQCFSGPLNQYLTTYQELKKRGNERERRRVDMDRYKNELKNHASKPPKDPNVTDNCKAKYYASKEAYDELNAELVHDIPRVMAEMPRLLEPMLAAVMNGLAGWSADVAAGFARCHPLVNTLNMDPCFPEHAMTAKDQSAAGKNMSLYHNIGTSKVAEEKAAKQAEAAMRQEHIQTQNAALQNQHASRAGSARNYQQTASYQQSVYGGAGAGAAAPPPQHQPYGAPAQAPPYGGGAPPPQQAAPPNAYAAPQPAASQRGLPPPSGAGGALPPQPPPRLPQARGLYAFNASSPSELSFAVGDVLTVHSQQGDWWDAELNGARGIVPSNYVQLM